MASIVPREAGAALAAEPARAASIGVDQSAP
jgi:hypothetical protein